jgi:hypothetical protein
MSKKFFIFLIIFLMVFGFLVFEKVKAGSADNVYGWAWSDTIGWISFNCNSKVDTNGDNVGDEAMKVCDGGVNKYKVCNAGFPEAVPCPGANCVDACSVTNYGVHICESDSDPNPLCSGKHQGDLVGYAWAGGGQDAAGSPLPTIGWIRFDPPPDFTTHAYPTCPATTCPDGSPNYPAHLDFTTRKITGWARACAGTVNGDCNSATRTDGWDGWILMGPIVKSGWDFGVKLVKTGSADFHYYAWGGFDTTNQSEGVIGWISFNCAEGHDPVTSICSTSNYKVQTSLTLPNFPPNQPTGPNETSDNCCYGCMPTVAQGVQIKLNWTYAGDPDGDPQYGYEIWLDDSDADLDIDPSLNSKFNHIVVPSSSTSYTLNLSDDDNHDWLSSLSFGQTYYWKVRVRDQTGDWSRWSAHDSFTLPAHPYPYVYFDWTPSSPNAGDTVQFCSVATGPCSWLTSSTACYDTKCSWSWEFPLGSPPTSTLQNPTVIYPSPSNKTVTLTVSDIDNYSCKLTRSLKVGIPSFLPEWREIPPF